MLQSILILDKAPPRSFNKIPSTFSSRNILKSQQQERSRSRSREVEPYSFKSHLLKKQRKNFYFNIILRQIRKIDIITTIIAIKEKEAALLGRILKEKIVVIEEIDQIKGFKK